MGSWWDSGSCLELLMVRTNPLPMARQADGPLPHWPELGTDGQPVPPCPGLVASGSFLSPCPRRVGGLPLLCLMLCCHCLQILHNLIMKNFVLSAFGRPVRILCVCAGFLFPNLHCLPNWAPWHSSSCTSKMPIGQDDRCFLHMLPTLRQHSHPHPCNWTNSLVAVGDLHIIKILALLLSSLPTSTCFPYPRPPMPLCSFTMPGFAGENPPGEASPGRDMVLGACERFSVWCPLRPTQLQLGGGAHRYLPLGWGCGNTPQFPADHYPWSVQGPSLGVLFLWMRFPMAVPPSSREAVFLECPMGVFCLFSFLMLWQNIIAILCISSFNSHKRWYCYAISHSVAFFIQHYVLRCNLSLSILKTYWEYPKSFCLCGLKLSWHIRHRNIHLH